MKPSRSILDHSFHYVPAAATSVAETWRRFGWRPTTDDQRKARRRPETSIAVDSIAAVRPFRRVSPGAAAEFSRATDLRISA